MTVNKLTYPAKENAVQEKINEIIDNLGASITVDQTYDGTSVNPQSGVAIQGELSTNYADTTLSNVSSIDSNSAVQTALDGKADTSLSNLSANGKTVIDGEWVNVNTTVVNTATSLNGSSNLPYALSLPNDGHNYMVLLFVEGDTGNKASNVLNIRIGSDICSSTTVARNRTRTASTVALGGNIYLPVSSSHNIYVSRSTGWTGSLTGLVFIGYRRIGTNS